MGTSRHLSLTSLSNTSNTAGIGSAMGPEVDCWVGVGPNGCPSTHLRHGHMQSDWSLCAQSRPIFVRLSRPAHTPELKSLADKVRSDQNALQVGMRPRVVTASSHIKYELSVFNEKVKYRLS